MGRPIDEELARAAGRGDLDAFRGLVDRHRGRILSLALRLVRDRMEAEDMTQEAFLRIYRGLPGFRGDAAFTTWMTRVALNTFHRYLRRLPRTEPLACPAGDPDGEDGTADLVANGAGPEAGAAAAQAATRIRRLVAGLPQPFREAVVLFYLQERSVEQAAAALGVSIGTLKSRLFRGREMLLRRWREGALS
jgi:RNA polymerase sigma-70 factor (ECF subfamily)